MSAELLLIDDDASASALRKRVLERHNYRVQLALDGATGIALAAALRPSLIMLDHSMPGLSGVEVLRALRNVVPDTPVISHSGFEHLANIYHDATPDAFLVKGDRVSNMLLKIAELLPH